MPCRNHVAAWLMSAKKPLPQTARKRDATKPPKVATCVNLSRDYLLRAKQMAADDGRGLSNWLEKLIRQEIAKESN